ncbi:hypothetical protein TNCV_4993681 [Trichonephila clavipes]|nr:hypothetical protein TNCV_4993681 [Trichonephila clavipes]
MTPPMLICTKEEIRAMNRFLFKKGVIPAKILRCVQAKCGDNCLSPSKIYEWIKLFKQERTSLCDDERSGSPSASTTKDNLQVIEGVMMEGGLPSTQGRFHNSANKT